MKKNLKTLLETIFQLNSIALTFDHRVDRFHIQIQTMFHMNMLTWL